MLLTLEVEGSSEVDNAKARLQCNNPRVHVFYQQSTSTSLPRTNLFYHLIIRQLYKRLETTKTPVNWRYL